MPIYEVSLMDDFQDWREKSRALLEAERAPEQVLFRLGESLQASLDGLWSTQEAAGESLPPAFAPKKYPKKYSVPAEFLKQLRIASVHRDEGRWTLFYRLLWRITHGEADLLKLVVDPDVAKLLAMHRSVRRDMHKMTAFVRFREMSLEELDGKKLNWFVAWYEPDHRILKLTAPFFLERFNGMRFSILTPADSLHWDGETAVWGPGSSRSSAPQADEMEFLWKTYYASIFNPARIKTGAMKKEMAVRYWKNLPEAALIPELIRKAPVRLQEFYRNQTPGAEKWLPRADARTLETVRQAARSCRACGICENATQTVFGEGPIDARVVLVGEQPGDEEDRAGRPFIGPAGQLLDEALRLIEQDRAELYVTNAVKHFKWVERGTKRLHQRPSSAEISACKPWLSAELSLLQPKTLVCLGVSAAQSVLGKAVVLRDVRGRSLRSAACQKTWVTTHPAAILRTQDPAERNREFSAFVSDLKMAFASKNASWRSVGLPATD